MTSVGTGPSWRGTGLQGSSATRAAAVFGSSRGAYAAYLSSDSVPWAFWAQHSPHSTILSRSGSNCVSWPSAWASSARQTCRHSWPTFSRLEAHLFFRRTSGPGKLFVAWRQINGHPAPAISTKTSASTASLSPADPSLRVPSRSTILFSKLYVWIISRPRHPLLLHCFAQPARATEKRLECLRFLEKS